MIKYLCNSMVSETNRVFHRKRTVKKPALIVVVRIGSSPTQSPGQINQRIATVPSSS
jgi:hypothetical protein